ncbi:MAG: AAA family ATPase [Candidatus Methanomethylicaceae archaeon]
MPTPKEVKKLPRSINMNTAVQIWVGRPKIGKTSTAAALGTVAERYGVPLSPFFLLFEAGAAAVDILCTCEDCPHCGGQGCDACANVGQIKHVLGNLEETEEWLDWVCQSNHNPVVFDTIDGFYQLVSDQVCQELGIKSPSEAEFGIAWRMIYDRTRALLGKVLSAGKGLILISHVYMQERRTKNGTITQVATFNISGMSRSYIAGLADQILHFDIQPSETNPEEPERILIARPQVGIDAGDRWGIFPETLVLGRSPEEAAEALLKVYGYITEQPPSNGGKKNKKGARK